MKRKTIMVTIDIEDEEKGSDLLDHPQAMAELVFQQLERLDDLVIHSLHVRYAEGSEKG